MSRHGAVVLAAGASRRLGRPKQLLQIDGETLVHRAARLALATAALETRVVLGHGAELIAQALADLPVHLQYVQSSEQGMGATLAAGVANLPPQCTGVLVLLCDQPALDAAHLQALVRCWQQSPQRAIASAYAGISGVPALLPRSWLESAALQGDRGARDLLRQRQDEVFNVENQKLCIDIDSEADLPSL